MITGGPVLAVRSEESSCHQGDLQEDSKACVALAGEDIEAKYAVVVLYLEQKYLCSIRRYLVSITEVA